MRKPGRLQSKQVECCLRAFSRGGDEVGLADGLTNQRRNDRGINLTAARNVTSQAQDMKGSDNVANILATYIQRFVRTSNNSCCKKSPGTLHFLVKNTEHTRIHSQSFLTFCVQPKFDNVFSLPTAQFWCPAEFSPTQSNASACLPSDSGLAFHLLVSTQVQ